MTALKGSSYAERHPGPGSEPGLALSVDVNRNRTVRHMCLAPYACAPVVLAAFRITQLEL